MEGRVTDPPTPLVYSGGHQAGRERRGETRSTQRHTSALLEVSQASAALERRPELTHRTRAQSHASCFLFCYHILRIPQSALKLVNCDRLRITGGAWSPPGRWREGGLAVQL